MLLTTSMQSITAKLAGAVGATQLPITADFEKILPTGGSAGYGGSNTVTNDTTAVTVVGQTVQGPSGSTSVFTLRLRSLTIYNADNAAATVTLTLADSAGTDRIIHKDLLAVGDTLNYSVDKGFYVTTSSGAIKQTQTAGSANQLKQVIVIPVGTLVLIADTNTYSVRVPFAFTVLSAVFVTDKPATTSNKLTTLTLSTTGGAVTGGVMALTSANQTPTGATVAATAISGATATQTAGSAIILTASSTTAFVEGTGHAEITISNNA